MELWYSSYVKQRITTTKIQDNTFFIVLCFVMSKRFVVSKYIVKLVYKR